MARTISGLSVRDIRTPTSRTLAGSDAVHTDPDYSATYVVLTTDARDGLEGHGMTFTLGRGNEVVVAAVRALQHLIVGSKYDDIVADLGGFWQRLTFESQLRWIGPEKGAIHLATAAIVNAVWDLYAKVERKPVWKLVADMTPEQFVACIDFRYLTDALTRDDALNILRGKFATRGEREAQMRIEGYPAYITSAGWMGYPDDKVRRLCREALAAGWTRFKIKVGRDSAANVHRAALVREEIGPRALLMMEAAVSAALGITTRSLRPWLISVGTRTFLSLAIVSSGSVVQPAMADRT